MTFCWFPPDRSLTSCSGSSRPIRRSAITGAISWRSALRSISPSRRTRRRLGSEMFSRTDKVGKMPSFLRSSGTSARPRPARSKLTHREHGLVARRVVLLGVELLEPAPEHGRDQAVRADLPGRPGADVAPVPQHGHAVTDLVGLG